MSEEYRVRSLNGESADLTLTEEYLVLKGKHYDVINGYLRASEQPKAIRTKDILHMEYVNLRSKRVFMAFIIMMALGALLFTRVLPMVTQRGRMRMAMRMYNRYNSLLETNIGSIMAAGGMLYILYLAVCVFLLAWYLLAPYRILRISTVGGVIAVKRKHYSSAELECLINDWSAGKLQPFVS